MKQMGRWVFWLLVAELIFFFWVGLRVQARYQEPMRIIGEWHAPEAVSRATSQS